MSLDIQIHQVHKFQAHQAPHHPHVIELLVQSHHAYHCHSIHAAQQDACKDAPQVHHHHAQLHQDCGSHGPQNHHQYVIIQRAQESQPLEPLVPHQNQTVISYVHAPTG